jgi:hypothetical protein
MFVFEIRDLFVIISVFLFTIPQFILFSIIVDNLSLGNRDFKYFLTGSYLIFYIAFVYPFMYLNVYIGIVLYWIMTIFVITYFIFKKIPIWKSIKSINLSNPQKILIVILVATQILVFYGDAFFHISHNFPDTHYNYMWIKLNVIDIGNIGYFPGLSIVSILPVSLIDPLYSLNYFAASLGLVFTICINLILKPVLSFKGLIIFNLILLTPFYYALTYTRIGLNNSQIYPIIFFSIIMIILIKWQDNIYAKYIYCLALSTAALVTAPHIFFLTTPGILLALILTYNSLRIKSALWLAITSLTSIFFASQLSSPDIIFDDKNVDSETLNLTDRIYVLISDWLRIKLPIRSPLESMESLGSYLVIVFAVGVLLVSNKRRSKPIIFVSILTIIYGISLQTGIGEFAFMKGRIGWYFMFTSALLLSLVADQARIQLPKKIRIDILVGSLLILNLIIILFNLPDAYRKDNEKILIEIKKIIAKENRTGLNIYSDLPQMRYVSEKITITQDFSAQEVDYFVLNNDDQVPDLILANIRAYEDRNFQKFNELQLMEINKRLEKNKALYNYARRLGYVVVVEEKNFLILKKR